MSPVRESRPAFTLLRRMPLAAASLSAGLFLGTAAPPSMLPDPVVEVGLDSRSVTACDVDADGVSDLVAVSSLEGVSVLMGRPDGTFEDRRLSPIGYGGWDLVVRDFNGDAWPDVAVSGYYQEYVAVALGHGDGSFGPEARFPTEYRGLSLAAADFNGDHRDDLAVTNLYDESVSILLGNGDGTFGAEVRIAAGERPQLLGAGDLNRDGFDDLVVSGEYRSGYSGQEIWVAIAAGGGTFLPATRYPILAVPSSLDLVDWNQDGALDLTVADHNSGISIRSGLGDGTFGPETRIGVDPYASNLSHADLDRDGDEDLLVTHRARNQISVLAGRGDGTFEPARVFSSRVAPESVAVEDFDRDGTRDLAVLDSTELTLLFGEGHLSFAPEPLRQERFPVGGGPYAIAAADLDGDGITDLVTANRGSDDLSVLMGIGGGRFQPERRIVAGDGARSVAAADLNLDGKADLVVSNGFSWDVIVFLGLGDGTFEQLSRIPLSRGRDVAVADFNRDGRPDLAVQGLGEVILLFGRGDGTFGAEFHAAMGEQPFYLTVGDVNLDGNLDVVSAGGEELYVLLGNGDGTTQAALDAAAVTLAGGFTDVAILELTGDGLPDIVTLGSYLLVFPGDGNGGVGVEELHRTSQRPSSIVTGDLNGDGIDDVATTGLLPGDVSVLLNAGGGAVLPQMRFLGNGWPRGIVRADLDGDGAPDLAVVNEMGEDVSILLNQQVLPNLPPAALVDWKAEVDCATGSIDARLDGSGSVDLNSSAGTSDDIIAVEWLEYELTTGRYLTLGASPQLEVNFPAGEHLVAFSVTDSHGERDSEWFWLTGAPDVTPPDLYVTIEPGVLWPPDGRMVEVAISVDMADTCGPVAVVLESVLSDEPDAVAGQGSGDLVGDIQGAALGTRDLAVALRAERLGSGDGRTYTLTYRATDPAGNSVTASAQVTVPHDRGRDSQSP